MGTYRTWIWSAALGLALATTNVAARSDALEIPPHLQAAVALARQNQLPEAATAFEAAVREHPRDAVAHAWLGDMLRRQGKFEEARIHASTALELDSCQSFAHAVMGDLLNPQYQGVDRDQSEDASRAHYLKAVACDPHEGGAWECLWTMAVRHEDPEWERRALSQLDETGFWTPALMEYNRWVLEGAPKDAVLLVNGDMDTFPTLILQQRGVRPDVAVFNVSLLNLEDYRRALAKRFGIPLPPQVQPTYRDDRGRVILESSQVIQHWVELSRRGQLARPVVAALSVELERLAPVDEAAWTLSGGHYRLRREGEGPEDIEAVRRQLQGMDPSALRPPYASGWDRSPVRCAAADNLAMNPLAAALRTSSALLDGGDVRGACELLRWAQRYRSEAQPPDRLDGKLAELDAACVRQE